MRPRRRPIAGLVLCCVLAACAQGNSLHGAPYLPPDVLGGGAPRAVPVTIVHAFDPAKGDGSIPTDGLVNVKGTLYGTTFEGGTHPGETGDGNGVVFSMKPDGSNYRVLHDFAGEPNDGSGPKGVLVYTNGLLYGATVADGKYRGGTIYSIDPNTGSERIVYNFGNVRQDKYAASGPLGVVLLNGVLYGVTDQGGKYNTGPPYNTEYGTVFSVTLAGKEKVLYNFRGSENADADIPHANLIALGNTLYGTTQYGGGNNIGTVFSVTTSGQERVLHSFASTGDGNTPLAGLTAYGGVIYGTTAAGGRHGGGTVFSITRSGQYHTLFSFDNKHGAGAGVLIGKGGLLYGTTGGGGSIGYGVAYSLTLAGTQRILYNFPFAPGPCGPDSALLDVGGALYGTTGYGGKYYQYPNYGGTVFRLTL